MLRECCGLDLSQELLWYLSEIHTHIPTGTVTTSALLDIIQNFPQFTTT
ncbi:hypothetical protein GCK32_022588 [Trichostrongylus colubriformis]|uniref:Uncharacterized protein n=1 Tax=Trichostrongylus colubriformis TaxID=6319 RepID=A0AAN8FCK0_TRICO